jgi:ABC-2 type transport system permease protein/sodium transport system permease protein
MIAEFPTQPLWLILITMGLVPAIFEEFCFRGFLFQAFRTRLSGAWTVVVSATVFGIFHELFFPGRLLSSTFIGLVLGWVRLRTRSILPGILLHTLHNSLLLTVIYYQDELKARGWGLEEKKHLPLTWQTLGLLGIIVGVGLLVATTQTPNRSPNESSSIA